MTMNERRAEIMRILTARRSITMPELARTFQVTTRTIQNDVVALTVDYPLETQQGKGGCVKVAQWYHPHRNILSGEQQRVLAEIMQTASEQQAQGLPVDERRTGRDRIHRHEQNLFQQVRWPRLPGQKRQRHVQLREEQGLRMGYHGHAARGTRHCAAL